MSTTKTRITAAFLATLPMAMADQVRSWKEHYRKAFVRLESRESVYIEEDGRYTAYNIQGDVKSHRASGEWAGLTGMDCNTTVRLPVGCAMVEEVIFLGEPMLKIFTGTAMPDAACEIDPELAAERAALVGRVGVTELAGLLN